MGRMPAPGEAATLSDAAAGRARPEPGADTAAGSRVKAHERAALKWVSVAAAIILVATILSWIIPAAAVAANGNQPLIPPAGSNVTANQQLIATTVSISVGIGMLVGVLGFYFLYLGFAALRDDDEGFLTPSRLALVGIPAVLLFGIAALLLTPQLGPLIDCISTTGISSACYSAAGTYIAGYYLVVWLGVILYVVGGIGVLIGIWRLGSRYREVVFKVGAILLIFPAINVIGAILILVGGRQARRKVEAGGPAVWDG